MARRYLDPLGFIEEITEKGGTFVLSDPEESKQLKSGSPVTVWRYLQDHLALGRTRGIISAVGFTRATFKTIDSSKDSRWPQEEDILKPRIPVYLALPGSYEPDGGRMLSQEKADAIHRGTARRRNAEGIAGTGEDPAERPDKTTRD